MHGEAEEEIQMQGEAEEEEIQVRGHGGRCLEMTWATKSLTSMLLLMNFLMPDQVARLSAIYVKAYNDVTHKLAFFCYGKLWHTLPTY